MILILMVLTMLMVWVEMVTDIPHSLLHTLRLLDVTVKSLFGGNHFRQLNFSGFIDMSLFQCKHALAHARSDLLRERPVVKEPSLVSIQRSNSMQDSFAVSLHLKLFASSLEISMRYKAITVAIKY
jgi:hypothetical protein